LLLTGAAPAGIYANLMWVFEGGRKDSTKGAHINGAYAHGLFDAWYMSICIGLTVGYGDKVPITFVGKFLTVIYIYASFYCIFSFFGSVTSDIYSGSLRAYQTDIQTTADLKGLRVGSYFTQAQVTLSMAEPSLPPIKQYGNVNLAYQAMLNGDIDVLVDDTVSAYYRVGANDYEGKLFVAGQSFLPVPYGMYMSRPNGEMHPLYPHFYRAVIDYTQVRYAYTSTQKHRIAVLVELTPSKSIGGILETLVSSHGEVCGLETGSEPGCPSVPRPLFFLQMEQPRGIENGCPEPLK